VESKSGEMHRPMPNYLNAQSDREGQERLQRSLSAVEERRPGHSGSQRSTGGIRPVAVMVCGLDDRRVGTIFKPDVARAV
jgi:hypothetical protein